MKNGFVFINCAKHTYHTLCNYSWTQENTMFIRPEKFTKVLHRHASKEKRRRNAEIMLFEQICLLRLIN